jgi:hypothetical protein
MRRAAGIERNGRDEKMILDELRKHYPDLKSINELVFRKIDFRPLIPVLVGCLKSSDNFAVKATIVGAMIRANRGKIVPSKVIAMEVAAELTRALDAPPPDGFVETEALRESSLLSMGHGLLLISPKTESMRAILKNLIDDGRIPESARPPIIKYLAHRDRR